MARKEIIKSQIVGNSVLTENSGNAKELYDINRFGNITKEGRVQLSLVEALYLMEKEKLEIYDGRNHKLTNEEYIKRYRRKNRFFWTRYIVFKDLRERGYVVKTALKFGADYRVYDRGVKPGEDHAKWVVFPVHESEAMTWYDFAAKNRVAHSTKKRLLLGVVDDESDVSYWECKWIRP